MNSVILDLRYAFRALIRSPGFAVVTMLTLALGIGANTAVFSVINALLLKTLPYRDAGRLVTLWESREQAGMDRSPVSPPNFLDWKAESRSLRDMAAYRYWGFDLSGGAEPERITGARVSATLLPLLGVQPEAGRGFLEEEDQFGARPVVMASDALWRRRFGADPRLVGSTLRLNGGAYTIIGILPPDADLPAADVWVPLALEPYALTQRGDRSLTVLARLAPGATLAGARAEMQTIARRAGQLHPDADAGWDAAVVPLRDQLVAGIRPTLLLLWAAVGLVLLIGCANVANLMLARATTREREVALRAALGASRGRLVRQLLTESLVLGVAGGAAGVLLACAGVEAAVAVYTRQLAHGAGIGIDGRVLAFAVGIALAAGVAFGLVPAWRFSSPSLGQSLKEGGERGGVSTRASLYRSALVAGEVALALVLLIGAGLLLRSLVRLQAVDPGFRTANALTMTVSLPESRYAEPHRKVAFFQELQARLGALPGVTSAALASHLPLAGRSLTADVEPEGQPVPAPNEPRLADYVSVTPGFFRVMGIPLVAGRDLASGDVLEGPPVVVINAAMARRYWANRNPIGRRVVVGATVGADVRPRTIVGVVGDVRAAGLESEPAPAMYVCYFQNPWPTMNAVVRTVSDPASLAAAVRAQVRALDANQPVYNLRSLDEVLGGSLALRRTQARLLSVFTLAALLLAAVGVYGVVAHAVARRTHEVGIRMALGARRGDVLRLVVGQGIRPVAIGLALGCLGALGASKTLAGLLFGVAPTDAVTFAGASFVLLLVALAACWLPARRATRVDPVVALRSE